MIRGAQKRMIVIRTHDSRVFEEAYFVMRRDSEMAIDDGDMISEADRIIRRSMAGAGEGAPLSGTQGIKRWVARLCWLGAGLLLGSGGTGLLWMLLG